MVQKNVISWFEIGTTDLDRATKFYEAAFNVNLIPMDMDNIKMRMFPTTDMQEGIGGALVDSGGFHKPSATDGPLIYLNDINTYTVQLGLRSFVDSTGSSDWTSLFAMSNLSLVPVFLFFLFFQRLLIEGIATTGMKR